MRKCSCLLQIYNMATIFLSRLSAQAGKFLRQTRSFISPWFAAYRQTPVKLSYFQELVPTTGRRTEFDVECRYPSPGWVSPVTRLTLPTCRAHYLGRPDRCARRYLPCPRGLPRNSGGSASASSLSIRLHSRYGPLACSTRPRRPSSRGFDPAGRPATPLVSYQSHRQLSGWNLPPLVNCAIGTH